MENTQKSKTNRFSAALIIAIIVVSLLAAGLLGYSISNSGNSARINDLQNQITALQEKILNLNSTQYITNENNTYYLGNNISLSQLYDKVKDSVVVVEGIVPEYGFFGEIVGYEEVQGSGFVYNSTGTLVIVTNYHVIQGANNITVTFTDGDAYAANVTGYDPYADLAVLSSATVPQYEYKPLNITSSSTLKVGDPVVAVGSPLGLTGSMTSGIVSALGRSVPVSWSNYTIADCIQTTAPINPGNSGGPLLNYQGEVVGITSYTAITSQGVAAQGLGLAIPSSTILREIESLVMTGSYNEHPWLGISFSPYFGSGTAAIEGLPDMTYEIAKEMGTNITYGVLIDSTVAGGPAATAGLRGGTEQVQILGVQVTIGGDIIIAINGTRITGMNDLSTYLEEYTSPNEIINVTIVRNNHNMTLPVTLGKRPPPT